MVLVVPNDLSTLVMVRPGFSCTRIDLVDIDNGDFTWSPILTFIDESTIGNWETHLASVHTFEQPMSGLYDSETSTYWDF